MVKTHVVSDNAVKVCGDSRGILHPFLTSALDGGEWSTSRPGRLTSRQEPGSCWIWGWMGHRTSPGRFGGKSLPMPGFEPGPPTRNLKIVVLTTVIIAIKDSSTPFWVLEILMWTQKAFLRKISTVHASARKVCLSECRRWPSAHARYSMRRTLEMVLCK
jgi:hypothetical protein